MSWGPTHTRRAIICWLGLLPVSRLRTGLLDLTLLHVSWHVLNASSSLHGWRIYASKTLPEPIRSLRTRYEHVSEAFCHAAHHPAHPSRVPHERRLPPPSPTHWVKRLRVMHVLHLPLRVLHVLVTRTTPPPSCTARLDVYNRVKNVPQHSVTESSRISTRVSHSSSPPVTLDMSKRVENPSGASQPPSDATRMYERGVSPRHSPSKASASCITQTEPSSTISDPLGQSPARFTPPPMHTMCSIPPPSCITQIDASLRVKNMPRTTSDPLGQVPTCPACPTTPLLCIPLLDASKCVENVLNHLSPSRVESRLVYPIPPLCWC